MMQTFDDIQKQRGQLTLDLSGNLFNCHCNKNHTTTMHWLRHTDVKIVNFHTLTCFGHNDEELIHEKDWTQYRDICSIHDEVIKASIASAMATAAVFTIVWLLCWTKINKYRLQTIYRKLVLATKRNNAKLFEYDVYICYVHDDDQTMEEMREFIEDKNNLKCCIPQRDFGGCYTDDVMAMEQSLERSATTMVLWSHAALASKWHKAEYKMARYIELYRHFNHRVIHVCLQDMSDVSDADLKPIISNGKFIDWNSSASALQRDQLLNRLLWKIYRQI